MYESRRRSLRFPIFAIAELSGAAAEQEGPVTTMVDNISLHGMGVYSLKPIRSSEDIQVKIRFIDRDGTEKMGILTGDIVWSIKYHEVYLVGIAFKEEISPSNNPELYSYYMEISPVRSGHE